MIGCYGCLLSLLLIVTPMFLIDEVNSIDCSDDSCIYPPTCKQVTVGENYLTVQDSPFYQLMAIDTGDINSVDNICNTVMPMDDSSVLIYRSIVMQDGTNVIEKQIQTFIAGCPNVGKTVSVLDGTGCSTCTQNFYTLGTVCNNQAFVVYKCFIFGDCDSLDDSVDDRIALSKDPIVSDCCYESILQLANAQSCLRGRNFTRLPYKLNRKCVISSNGVPTINAGQVPAEDALCLP